jgi:hypothetical protein
LVYHTLPGGEEMNIEEMKNIDLLVHYEKLVTSGASRSDVTEVALEILDRMEVDSQRKKEL